MYSCRSILVLLFYSLHLSVVLFVHTYSFIVQKEVISPECSDLSTVNITPL